jgi:hypothetical protein
VIAGEINTVVGRAESAIRSDGQDRDGDLA